MWSLSSGHAFARMATGRSAAQVQTFVHALCVTEYVAKFVTAVILVHGHEVPSLTVTTVDDASAI